MPDTLRSLAEEIVGDPPSHWEQNSMGSTTGKWRCSFCDEVVSVGGSYHEGSCVILRLQCILKEDSDA